MEEVAWREVPAASSVPRFAALRVRPAHRDFERSQPYPQEWLLVEWPSQEAEPTKTGCPLYLPTLRCGTCVRGEEQRLDDRRS